MGSVKKIALVGCSDPLPEREKEDLHRLVRLLQAQGLTVECSPLLFEDGAAPKDKGEILNRAFRGANTDMIFDVSGGDLANTVLPWLDFDAISGSRAIYAGFSDLTVIINAIIAKTGKPAINYQIRNLVYSDAPRQQAFFTQKLLSQSFSLADLEPRFLRGSALSGKIYGGNIRCFLKLAGTPYLPDIEGGILLLESLGGGVYQMITALEQYRQMGIFDKIGGILLGTFTNMKEKNLTPTIEALVLEMTPDHIPVAVTPYVGHYPDARPVLLGREVRFE